MKLTREQWSEIQIRCENPVQKHIVADLINSHTGATTDDEYLDDEQPYYVSITLHNNHVRTWGPEPHPYLKVFEFKDLDKAIGYFRDYVPICNSLIGETVLLRIYNEGEIVAVIKGELRRDEKLWRVFDEYSINEGRFYVENVEEVYEMLDSKTPVIKVEIGKNPTKTHK